MKKININETAKKSLIALGCILHVTNFTFFQPRKAEAAVAGEEGGEECPLVVEWADFLQVECQNFVKQVYIPYTFHCFNFFFLSNCC